MPISDLTGTTWKFNDEFLVPEGMGTFEINYTFANSVSGSYLWMGWDGDMEEAAPNCISMDMSVYPFYKSGVWLSNDYKIITFTDGTDATNADLIALLEDVATQQQSSQLSVDLSTLSGWSNVSSGSHTLKVKAKATGYQDSALSAGVSFTKAGSGYDLTLNFIARNYRGAGDNSLNFKINATPSSAADIDYILNTPWAGSPGDFRENGEIEELVNLHYDEGGTYTLHNITSATMWIEYDDFDDSDYICINGSSDLNVAPAYPGVTMNLSADTTVNIYYDYDT